MTDLNGCTSIVLIVLSVKRRNVEGYSRKSDGDETDRCYHLIHRIASEPVVMNLCMLLLVCVVALAAGHRECAHNSLVPMRPLPVHPPVRTLDSFGLVAGTTEVIPHRESLSSQWKHWLMILVPCSALLALIGRHDELLAKTLLIVVLKGLFVLEAVTIGSTKLFPEAAEKLRLPEAAEKIGLPKAANNIGQAITLSVAMVSGVLFFTRPNMQSNK